MYKIELQQPTGYGRKPTGRLARIVLDGRNIATFATIGEEQWQAMQDLIRAANGFGAVADGPPIADPFIRNASAKLGR